MPFQKSKFLFLTTLLIGSFTYGSDSILSDQKEEFFGLEREQNVEDSAKLRLDWINPITYKYIHTYAEDNVDSKRSYISVNQPLFKSGGIFTAIIYANELEKYKDLDINLRHKAMIKDATKLLFEIHKTNYSIDKQILLVLNANIDIERKKEQVMNGFLDTSFLDNAILEANIRKNLLAELQYNKTKLVNSFNNLASKPYNDFELPQFNLIDEEKFLNHNLEISKQKASIKASDKYYFMTISKYLPTVNFTYDYTKYHNIKNSATYSTGDNIEQYGFNMTIPLDVRIKNDIQSNKIEYLKAKNNLESIQLEQINFFKSTMAKIKMLEEKINIAKEDYELYNGLLEVIVQEKNAELKTQSDVDTLANSQKIKVLERKMFELDRQVELLELYAKITIND